MSVDRPWTRHYDAGVPLDIDVPDIRVCDLLDRVAEQHGSAVALSYYEHEMTWNELRAQADAFACALRAHGLRAGDRLMLLLPNIPQAVIGLHGALRAGALVALADPLASADDIAHKVTDCAPRFVLTIRPVLGALLDAGVPGGRIIVTRMRDYLPPLRGAFVSLFDRRGALAAAQQPDLLWMREMMTASSTLPPDTSGAPSPPAADGPAVLAYTGGTTGLPRAVTLTHRGLVANTVQVRALFTDARQGEEVILAAVPFSHSFGLACIHLAMELGARLVLVPRFKSHDVLRLIARHRPTLFPGVPAMYVSLVNHPLVRRYPLGSIRACISGSTPLPVEVREAFERLTKGRLVEGYGLTEAGPVTHANPLKQTGKGACIGLPLPGTDARIIDPSTGAALPAGQVGELEVRGPQVMAGYWAREEDTRAALRDGWLRTGDLATMDEDGFFRVIGRVRDCIRIGEHEIYPRDVEEVLYEHPKVREAAVVGVLDHDRVVLRAHVVLRHGERANASEIITFCRGRLSPWKVPSLVKFERLLPRSAIGKVLRRLL